MSAVSFLFSGIQKAAMKNMTTLAWDMVCVTLSEWEMWNAPSLPAKGRAKPCAVRVFSPLKGNAYTQKTAGTL